VELSLAVDSLMVVGSSEVATVTIANTTSRTVDVYPVVGVRITAVGGKVVFDSHPQRIRHPLTKVPLAAGGVLRSAIHFVVPTGGTLIAGYLMDGSLTVEMPFHFIAPPKRGRPVTVGPASGST
jgi:hypothetical protein